jgi:D-galactarolactone cycloisomerase
MMRELLAPEHRDNDLSFVIKKAVPIVLRSPIETPVQTSFGIMRERPAVYLWVEDSLGNIGIGEVWCNFPVCGAEHRANLLNTVILPAIIGQEFSDPVSCFNQLQSQFQRLAIQAGEFGPIAQCIAGLDIALWDLLARRINTPLYRLMGGTESKVKVYASGINPGDALATVRRCRDAGYTAFKLKIGFGEKTDFDNISRITEQLSGNESLMVDANQAWNLDEAIQYSNDLEQFSLGWLEEPILANMPETAWKKLADNCPIPLAGGENIADQTGFDRAIGGDWFDVVQPDICKWGGFSAVLPIAKQTVSAGKRYCPHFLGGGVGLIASAHILAAVGGNGWLEVDSNPNPLRESLYDPNVTNGSINLAENAGLGITIDALDALCNNTHRAN